MTDSSHWTLFSNHGHVLICLARDPWQSLRKVALSVGITERAVQRIVADLENGGYLKRSRHGRQNRYVINRQASLRHPLEKHRSLDDLLSVFESEDEPDEVDEHKILGNWRVGEHGSEI